jgi:hypothetical protein
LLRRFARQDSVAGEPQVEAKESDQEKKQTGSDERHHHRSHRHDGDRPEVHFAPASVPKAAFAGQHRGRSDKDSDGTKENMYPENNTEN